MLMVIEQFQLVHDDRCPHDIDDLVAARVLPRRPLDPFGRPFVFTCSPVRVRVCSTARDADDPYDDVCVEDVAPMPDPGGHGVAAPGWVRGRYVPAW